MLTSRQRLERCEAVAQQVGARLQALGVLARPGQQVAQAVERRLLAEPRRADRDAVHRLLDLGHQAGAGGDAADAVAGQGEHLGEAVEMHQRAAPVGSLNSSCGRVALRQEILVGLVEQQGDAVLLRELEEGVDGRRRIDRAGRIVGRDQHDGARSWADQLVGVLGVGHGAGAGPEVERHRLDALHAHPHVVIEVVRARQDHLVAGLGDAHQGEAEGLVAARGDADLAGRDRARHRKTERCAA